MRFTFLRSILSMALFRYLLLFCFGLPALGVYAQQEEQEQESLDDPLWQQIEPERHDPWEPVNRKIFVVNESLDRYMLRPVARGYRLVTPDPVEKGVNNFIRNIYEFNTIANSILQGRVDNTIHSLGRLVINTTIGLGGFFDVATKMGVDRRPADFGQTLFVWGFDSGPFLMVPVSGPRTVRSGTGLVVDSFSSLPAMSQEVLFNWGFLGIEAIDARAQLLRADQLISGDKYIFVREAYMSRRETFLNDGVVDDSFSDFEEGEDFEEF
ncbi:MAG: VacJ family lipoprotein [Halioglobus sp.]|nr:VacJ family lipoprotein [Halioglobus sp.]